MKYVVHRFFYTAAERTSDYQTIYVILKDMVWVNIPMIMFAALKFVKDYFLETRRKSELYNQNLQAELSILKVQLKPHFLFNTLNNLYSMALEGSEKTAVGIERVTGLMKYIIYECSEDKVSIGKEIQLISDYLELEKLRYDHRLLLETSFTIQDPSLKIAPLILFTFVENCFKHGSSRDAGKPFIRLALSDKDGALQFTAENSIPQKVSKPARYEGLGLKNVKRRLDYLYPGRYILEVRQDDRRYSVQLEIDTRK
jgi:LytS/YehU family sensor histidine kinase